MNYVYIQTILSKIHQKNMGTFSEIIQSDQLGMCWKVGIMNTVRFGAMIPRIKCSGAVVICTKMLKNHVIKSIHTNHDTPFGTLHLGNWYMVATCSSRHPRCPCSIIGGLIGSE